MGETEGKLEETEGKTEGKVEGLRRYQKVRKSVFSWRNWGFIRGSEVGFCAFFSGPALETSAPQIPPKEDSQSTNQKPRLLSKQTFGHFLKPKTKEQNQNSSTEKTQPADSATGNAPPGGLKALEEPPKRQIFQKVWKDFLDILHPISTISTSFFPICPSFPHFLPLLPISSSSFSSISPYLLPHLFPTFPSFFSVFSSSVRHLPPNFPPISPLIPPQFHRRNGQIMGRKSSTKFWKPWKVWSIPIMPTK